MQDQIDTLKQEVADWKEEARRKDHLLAAALERIPAIEAPPDTPSESTTDEREPPVMASEERGNGRLVGRIRRSPSRGGVSCSAASV
jgi:hypothetical protein